MRRSAGPGSRTTTGGGLPTLTRAFDTGHELRVRRQPGRSGQASVPAEGTSPGSATHEVPRAGWPAPVRPVGRAPAVPEPSEPSERSEPQRVPPGPGAPRRSDGDGDRDRRTGSRSRAPAATPGDPHDDEVAADIAAILAEGQEPPPEARPAPGARAPRPAPAAQALPPPPPSKHAIFDQLAASMAGAKAYDLGAVELERRFDEFDRQQDAAPAPPRPSPAERPRAAGTRAAVEPRPTEVLDDLDAIRSQAQGALALDPGVGGRSIGADALEPGDIILSTTTEPISAHIRAVTGADVSHACVYVGDGRVVEAIADGVVLRSLDTALADDSLAVAYRHRDMTPTKAAIVVPFLQDHARRKAPYDRWGLVRVAPGQLARAICSRFEGEERRRCQARAAQLRVGTDDEDAFFCSELVLEAFQRAGLPISTLQPSWSSPGEIAELRHNGLLDYVGHLKG